MFSSKINIFCSREILLYIAWACLRNIKPLTFLSLVGSNLVGDPEDSFCHDAAHVR